MKHPFIAGCAFTLVLFGSSLICAWAAEPVIKAGKTTTGAAGTKAKVTSRKAGKVLYFDFVIPKGPNGLVGPVGPQGSQGPQGPAGDAASKARRLYFSGASLSYTGSGVTANQWGPTLTAAAAGTPGFVIPKPHDWDDTQTFSITLYFSLPSPPASNTVVNWRLHAGGNTVNSTSGNASTGWDSYSYWVVEDAASLVIPSVTGGYSNLAKSQTWTAKYSSTYNTWYFGNPGEGVTTANSFKSNPLWHFAFRRGNSVPNGESFTGDLTINGVALDYTAK